MLEPLLEAWERRRPGRRRDETAALQRAYEGLTLAAGDMNVAAILAPPRSALASDTNVLADALDAEQAALLAAIERYA